MTGLETWLLGYAGGKLADRLLERFRADPIMAELDAAYAKWAKSLPEEAQADPVYTPFLHEVPEGDVSSYPALTALRDTLHASRIPTEADWTDALVERWQAVRDTVADPAGFFLLDEEVARRHLQALARSFVTVCATHQKLFGPTVIDSLITLRPQLEKLTSIRTGRDGVHSTTDRAYPNSADAEAALARASRPALGWRRTLPDGTWIDRPELEQLLGILDGTEHSVTALIGAPGAGKSALLATVGANLQSQGAPFLAIKADFLDPSIQSERDLQEHLGLESLPTDLILQLARDRPVALLIDQLDALASYVDLRTGRLNVLLNIVRRVGDCHNVHVLLSARNFEYEHDVRLKVIRADSLILELPPWSVVLALLKARGIQAEGWPDDARALMRLPQALATFLQLSDRDARPPFHTYQAMLSQVWKERILLRPDGPRLSRLAATIAHTMAENETLWLAAARFDNEAAELDVLVATGIMTWQSVAHDSFGFSHQMVFMHVLARAFAQQEGRLSNYVLERQDSLFIRPKLWAALTYLREAEPATYEKELKAIWSRPDLRVHLRRLLIELLGQWPDPTDSEALLMEQAIQSSRRDLVLQSTAGSPGWFARLGQRHVNPAMVESVAAARSTISTLQQAWTFAPDQVLSMVRTCWLTNSEYDGLIWAVLQECNDWNEAVIEVATSVLQRTDVSPFAFDHAVATVGVTQPEAALALVRARLDRLLATAEIEVDRRKGLRAPDDPEGKLSWALEHSPKTPLRDLLEQDRGWESLAALAEAHPEQSLQVIFSWFKRVFAKYRALEDQTAWLGFPVSFVADFRFESEHSALQLREPALLSALRVAIEAFAANNAAGFLQWLDANQDEPAAPAQRLLAHALATQPRRYASRALRFLLDDRNRFYLGGVEDHIGTSKRLVGAASPFWSDEELHTFEVAVLQYAPAPPSDRPVESRRHHYQLLRKLRLELLSQLPAKRTSSAVQKLTREEARHFTQPHLGARFSGVHHVGSPITARGLAQARDGDIVNAFRNLPDATGWDHPRKRHVGGNIQLSREFSNLAKEQPDRAARLMERFEPSFGTRASGYALDAMSESADPELVLELIRSLHKRGFDGVEFRQSVASAIERLLRRDAVVDDDIVAILEEWLQQPRAVDHTGSTDTDATDDADGEILEGEPAETAEERHGAILWTGSRLAIVPQGAFPVLETLTQIFLARGEHDRLLALLRQHLTRPEQSDVWQSLLRSLAFLRPSSADELSAFLTAIFEQYPKAARSEEAVYLLAHAQWTVPGFVRSVLERWKDTQDPWLAQAYGELLALVAILQPALDWPAVMLAEIVEAPESAPARAGAAYSAVNLWHEPGKRAAAAELLTAIVPGADKRTWTAIFDLFRPTDEITPDGDWIAFLETFAAFLPNAPGVSSAFVVASLQSLLPHEATLVGRIAKCLVENWRNDLADLQTATAATAPELVDLAITLHRLGPETRDLGTSLFEDLLEIDAFEAQSAMNEIDSRFTEEKPRRRRLPRRALRRRRSSRSQNGSTAQ